MALTASFTYTAEGTTITFTNTSTSGYPITYVSWDFGDGAYSEDLNPVHTYPGVGTYAVYLYVEDEMESAETTLIVSTDMVSFTCVPLDEADSMALKFTDTSTDICSIWAWDFGDGSTANTQNPTHTYLVDGFYTVNLVTDKGSVSKEIQIKDNKNQKTLLVGGYDSAVSKGVIHRSTDAGTTWNKVYSYPNDAKVTSIVFI
jgi:PKD repeat protein